jgi:Neuraminidase (sialidase)
MAMPAKLGNYSGVLLYPTTRVLWRSRDNGYTWSPAYVFHRGNRTWNPRSQEHQIIDIGEGRLAVYSRDDGARESQPESSTIVKRYSSDGGHTWSKYEINNTPFVSSKCAFSVKQDPYLENTCWMFWTYNDKQDEPAVNNQPRTRLGLAVSYDNTASWQYVMDVDDWGFPSYDTTSFELNRQAEGLEKIGQRQPYLQRDNRYANLGLWVTRDYLYLTARRRFRHGTHKFDDFCIFYTRVEKTKIKTYPEFPGTRY